MTTYNNPTKVVTGNVIFSYLNCWDAKAAQPGATPKFSVSLLIDKSDTKTIDKIIDTAIANGAYGGKFNGSGGGGCLYVYADKSKTENIIGIMKEMGYPGAVLHTVKGLSVEEV